MSSDWPKEQLGAHVDLLTGFPFKSSHFTSGDGVRLLRGDNVGQGTLRWNAAKMWPATRLDGLERYILEEGDVIVAMDRPWIEAGLKYAQVSTRDVPSLLVQRVARLRADDSLDQTYLRYLIGSANFVRHVLSVQTGTAVPHISAAQIGAFHFNLPPLVEQRRIAGVLGALDDKIEHNRHIVRRLRSSVETAFRSWPWNGFTEASVGDVIELVYGKALKENERRPGAVAVYGSAGQVGWHDEALSAGPGIVIGRKGNPGVVTWSPADYYVIDTAFYVRPRAEKQSLRYLFHALRSVDFRAVSADSAVPGLNRDLAYQRIVKIHSERDIEAFDRFASPLMALEAQLERANARLAAIRDALLPRLVSGKLRVPETYVPA